jgi:hypothetical protein
MFEGKKLDLKKESEEILKIKGHERGADIKYLVKYAKLKMGDEGHRRIVEALRGIGYELPDTEKIDTMEWIPASLPTMYMVAMITVFDWSENDIMEMGKNLIALSPLLKIYIRFFVSPWKTINEGSKRFINGYDFGRVEIGEIDKNSVALKLYDFKKHKVTCYYFRGVFTKVLEMAIGSKNAQVTEKKCVFSGDDCHEFQLSW